MTSAEMTDARHDGTCCVVIVMGVAGSGKTTVGKLLATRLKMPFYDADDFHSAHNRQKLSHDEPLTDEDRAPWLDELARQIRRWSLRSGAVLACSALKHSYRKKLRSAATCVKFVFLDGDADLIVRRLTRRAQRENHIVKNFRAILEGQFHDLEIPHDAIQVRVDQPPDQIVDEILLAVEHAIHPD